ETDSMHHWDTVTAVVTGKAVEMGGSLGRREATGRGCMFVTREALAKLGMSLKGARVAVQGFGNVGSVAADMMAKEGAIIVAVSDKSGAVHNPQGLDIPDMLKWVKEHRQPVGYPKGGPGDRQLLRVGAGPRWLLLGRRHGEPAPREHRGARLQRGGRDDGEVQGEYPHRLLHRRGRSCRGDASAAWDVCLMRYRVVAVGRVRDAALRTACDGYLERLRRYTRVEEREVKDEARILEGVPEGSRLVALSDAGELWTSEQLADWTARWDQEGRDVTFAIGGAD